MRKYYLIAGVAIVAFIALGASSLMSSMTPYVTVFEKVRTATQDKVQVPGDLVKGKSTYDKRQAALVFFIKDPTGQEMKVIYKGVRPGNFDQADRVVAVGKYHDGAFHAEQLLVKCPSKYQNQGTGSVTPNDSLPSDATIKSEPSASESLEIVQWSFVRLSLKGPARYYQVSGEVKNKSSHRFDLVTFDIALYDETGKIIATGTALASNVGPYETAIIKGSVIDETASANPKATLRISGGS